MEFDVFVISEASNFRSTAKLFWGVVKWNVNSRITKLSATVAMNRALARGFVASVYSITSDRDSCQPAASRTMSNGLMTGRSPDLPHW